MNSLEREQVYLHSTENYDIILRLDLDRPVSTATMRRNATEKVTVLVPRGRLLNLTSMLDMPRDVVLDLLEKNEEVKRFGTKIAILDGNSRAHEASIPASSQTGTGTGTEALPEAAPDRSVGTITVGVAAQEQIETQVTLPLTSLGPDGHFREQVFPPRPEALTGYAKRTRRDIEPSSGQPTTGVTQEAVNATLDSIPQIGWPRQKLVERAAMLGIEVTAAMTKSSVLRAIREKSTSR